jgi:hypothetical protein
MKRNLTFLFLLLASIAANAQTVLLQETFQDWNAQDTILNYTITKKLYDGKTDGTFTSNALIVAPNKAIGAGGAAEGNANPTKGRIGMKGASTYLQLPELQSVGKVSIKASSGTDLKEFKLQVLKKGNFVDIPGTESPCYKTLTKLFTFSLNFSSPTTLRIAPTSGGSIFIWDLQVESYDSK